MKDLSTADRKEYYRDPPPNSFAPKEGDASLDIAIIGAGIAGLSAAVALTQCGHNVEVSVEIGSDSST